MGAAEKSFDPHFEGRIFGFSRHVRWVDGTEFNWSKEIAA
jgi:hypothetical protein